MKCFSLLILLSCAVYSFEYIEKSRYWKIDLVRRKTQRRKLLENRDHLKKYGYSFDKLTADPRNNDSINLFKYLDNEFYGTIQIGTPRVYMNVAFDTAWSLSWVVSNRCPIYQVKGCQGHKLYNHDNSHTWKKNGIAFNTNYNYTGFYSYDNIYMAHSNVTKYLFVEMTHVPDEMFLDIADGALGLGKTEPNDIYEPFLYTLHRQKKIKDLIFSVYLNRDRQSKRGGNIMLGFVDDKHIHKTELKNKTIIPDKITYLKCDPGRLWMFPMDMVLFCKSHNNCVTFCPNGCKALADTSTTQISGPKVVVDQIHDLINAQPFKNDYIVDCNTLNKLPKIQFILRNTTFQLTGKQYILRETKGTATECVSAFTPSLDDQWVLGGAFLAQFYSIYNINDNTIGFVRAA